jgi:chromosome segregation ATPase
MNGFSNHKHNNSSSSHNHSNSSTNDETTWRRLPLHEACTRHPPLDVIGALLQAYPEAATFPDHQKRLPLQVACVHGASQQVIICLLKSFPESILHRDSYGKTAAMSADACPSFKNGNGERNEILEALCKSPTEWYIQKEKDRCMVEEKKRIAAMEQHFERERLEFKAKMLRMQNRATDERLEYFTMKEGLNVKIEELSAEKYKMTRKVNALKQDQLDQRHELEGHIASREMEISALRTELADCKNSSAVLTKIDSMQQKLQQAMARNMTLEEELSVTTNEAATLATQLEDNTKCEAELQQYSQQVCGKLEEALKQNSILEENVSNLTQERDLITTTFAEERQAWMVKSHKEATALDIAIRTKIFELEKHVMEANMCKSQLQIALKQDKSALKSKSIEVARLAKELDVARSNEHDTHAKVTTLERQLQMSRNLGNTFTSKSLSQQDKSSAELARLRKSEAALKIKVSTLTRANVSALTQQQDSSSSTSSSTMELARLRRTEAVLQSKVTTLTHDLAAATKKNARGQVAAEHLLEADTNNSDYSTTSTLTPARKTVIGKAVSPVGVAEIDTDTDFENIEGLSPFERARLAFGNSNTKATVASKKITTRVPPSVKHLTSALVAPTPVAVAEKSEMSDMKEKLKSAHAQVDQIETVRAALETKVSQLALDVQTSAQALKDATERMGVSLKKEKQTEIQYMHSQAHGKELSKKLAELTLALERETSKKEQFQKEIAALQETCAALEVKLHVAETIQSNTITEHHDEEETEALDDDDGDDDDDDIQIINRQVSDDAASLISALDQTAQNAESRYQVLQEQYEGQLAEAVSSKAVMFSEHRTEKRPLLSKIETLETTVMKLSVSR